MRRLVVLLLYSLNLLSMNPAKLAYNYLALRTNLIQETVTCAQILSSTSQQDESKDLKDLVKTLYIDAKRLTREIKRFEETLQSREAKKRKRADFDSSLHEKRPKVRRVIIKNNGKILNIIEVKNKN